MEKGVGGTSTAATPAEARALLEQSGLMGSGRQNEEMRTLISCLKYANGKLAHFKYGTLDASLEVSEFAKLLSIIGTTQEKFDQFKQKFCYFVAGGYKCNPANVEYCDPNHCSGSR